MTKAKKIIIRTHSRELFVVRRTFDADAAPRGYCESCAAVTVLLSFDEAVGESKIGARKLMRLIEANCAHSIETANGHLLICADSLLKFSGEKE